MNLLHCYSGNMFGGVETALLGLARAEGSRPELVQEFALCFEGRLADELRAEGATVHVLGAVKVSRPWTIIEARRRLRRLLEERRPDVVACHSAWPLAVCGPVVK